MKTQSSIHRRNRPCEWFKCCYCWAAASASVAAIPDTRGRRADVRPAVMGDTTATTTIRATTTCRTSRHVHGTCGCACPQNVPRGGGGREDDRPDVSFATTYSNNNDDASLVFLEMFQEEVRHAREELEQETAAAFQQLRERIEAMNRERREWKRQRRDELAERQRQEKEEEERKQQEEIKENGGIPTTEEEDEERKQLMDEPLLTTIKDTHAEKLPEHDEPGSRINFEPQDEFPVDNIDLGSDDTIPETKGDNDERYHEGSLPETVELFQENDDNDDAQHPPRQADEFLVGDSDEEPDTVLSRLLVQAEDQDDDDAPTEQEFTSPVIPMTKETTVLLPEAEKKSLETVIPKQQVVSGGAASRVKRKKKSKPKAVTLVDTAKLSVPFDATTPVKKKKKKKKKKTHAVLNSSNQSKHQLLEQSSAPIALKTILTKGFLLMILYFVTTVLVRKVLRSVVQTLG